MDNANPKQQLLEKLKSSTNILVTVSANPSVDQLAACLGLTLWLNKLGKHGTAVFSGDVPNTLEFLQPEETLEKTTDSLRDFIIALDKSKADKLRYKVEDRVVKIFITPYRTSLSADDLEFSQGDFNVDMVVAVGVSAQEDLDAAITAHGRILHDATVTTINTSADANLGSINWNDTQASSLSELIVDLGNELARTQLDGQIATALLTGIVSETARFSNEKTTPQTMSISAQLMSAGANQQLVASKLDEPAPEEPVQEITAETDQGSEPEQAEAGEPGEPEPPKPNDGTLEIDHQQDEETDETPPEMPTEETNPEPFVDEPEPLAPEPEPELEAEVTLPELPETELAAPPANDTTITAGNASKLVTEPPTMGGTLTANSRPDDGPDPVTDPMSLPNNETQQPLLERTDAATTNGLQPAPPSWMPPQSWQTPAPTPVASPALPVSPADDETLTEIEQTVQSPHLSEAAAPEDLDSARDEVMKALNSAPDTTPQPVQALNAQSIDLNPPAMPEPQPVMPTPAPSTAFDPTAFGVMNDPDVVPNDTTASPDSSVSDPNAAPPELTGPINQPFTMPLPPTMAVPASPVASTPLAIIDPTAPPPVPPPLMPPSFPTSS